ncbi:Beta-lactamase domain protein [Tenacibaculum litopenaei]|uniref:MBL fold metallo-hydrolase n=1 Tax=Tenacibaculum litopenaei TaxID=396016 RepID=UPI0038946112
MKIQHFRNATMVVEFEDIVLLIDPMLGAKGSLPPFSFFRFRAKRNPIVALPEICNDTLNRVTHCLITHLHPDHLDAQGETFIRDKQIPVICSVKDEKELKKRGLQVFTTVRYWEKTALLSGTVEGIPARHGYGFVAKPAGNVMGFFLRFPGQPTVYLSSDTIYTEDVDKVLTSYRPDISVVAAGSAQFDIFKPLLMTTDDVLRFIRVAPGMVIANHMEAVNHCPTKRTDLSAMITSKGMAHKVWIPEDGAMREF